MTEPPTSATIKSSILIANATVLEDIRTRFLNIIGETTKLAQKTNALLNRDQVENCKNATEIIVEQLKMRQTLVGNMELRVSLVAPMKAGKSTIVNAILGEKILPTRNTAMTVIPTEVVLKLSSTNTRHQSEQAELSLPLELIKQLTNMRDKLRMHLRNSSNKLEDPTRQLSSHPNLESFAKTLCDGSTPEFKRTTLGNKAIWELLEFVNDVVRLYDCLMPIDNLAEAQKLCQNLPRITAPYRILGNENIISESLGRLVIIDTPGTNEDTTTNFLKEIVIKELKKATVILVILDFTALNTEADKLVKIEIMKMNNFNRNSSDAIFALVNKCDQRRREDMTTKDVCKFVRENFDIGIGKTEEHDNRVFEIQAIRALLAKQFCIELDQIKENETIRYQDLHSGQDFLTETYGAIYDEADAPTRQKIKSDAVKLWQKSGFERFLNGAVEKLIERAAPRILDSALINCTYGMNELRESLEVRERLLEADVTKLHTQISAFQDDFAKLSNIMKREKDAPHNEQQQLIENIRRASRTVFSNAERQLDTLLNEDLKFNEQMVTRETNVEENVFGAIDSLLVENTRMAIHHILVIIRQLLAKYVTSGSSIKFDSEIEGQEFLTNIKRRVQDIPEKAALTICETVDAECNSACQRLQDRLHKATQGILSDAQTRFTDTFNIELQKPPVFDLQFEEATESIIHMDKTYRPWWLLGLVDIPYDEGYRQGTTYHLKKASVKTHFTKFLRICMDLVHTKLNEYLKSKLEQIFDQHFHEIKSQLQKYQNYVRQSVSDHKRTIEEKAIFKKELLHVRGQLANLHERLHAIKADFQRQIKRPEDNGR